MMVKIWEYKIDLKLLMFKHPKKAKELSYKIIPWYVDNVIISSRDFHSRENIKEHEFSFITRFKLKIVFIRTYDTC